MGEWIITLNTFAAGWLEAIWRACWQGAIALTLVWVIVRFFPRLSPSICCWLWRLAFFKLLISFVWATPIELPLLPTKIEANSAWSLAPKLSAGKSSLIPSVPAQPNISVSPNQVNGKAVTSSPAPLPSYACVLFLLWLLGLIFHLVLLVKGWWAVRRIQSSCELVDEQEILSEYAKLCQQFGLRFVPRIAKSEQAPSPMLLGVFRPMIVLPPDLLGDCSLSQIRLILAHELAHLKRKDLLWGWLPAIARALFFFHPLVWLTQKEWQLAQEMACDEFVVLWTGLQPRGYAEVLLKVAEKHCCKTQKGWVVAGMSESFMMLKRRLIAMQFVKPISSTKALVWFVTLALLALVGIVPWRLVAQPSRQASRIQTRQVRVAVRVPLKKGMELTYEGLARVIVSGKEERAPVKVNEFVKEVTPDNTAIVVSLRAFPHPVDKSDISLRFISVQPDGKESAPDEKRLAGEIPPKLFSLHFVKVLPVYFIPQRNLKVGSSWVTKERLPIYLYVTTVNDQFLPWFEIEMSNRVVRQERIGGVRCLVVRRNLTKPVPIHGGNWAKRLSERNETLWVDAKTGLIHKVEAETILEGQKGKFHHNALQLQLKSRRMLTDNALKRRLKELEWVEQMQHSLSHLIVDLQVYRLWETLDGDKIDQAQAYVKSLLQDIALFSNRLFPNSPYIAYWTVQGETLTFLDEELERTEEFAERVGESAPDFELSSADGEKFKLSELQGKVILLQFAGIGLGRGGRFPRRQELEWLFSYPEQIHKEYKGKGVVVLGIWTVYPPERQKEVVKALNLAFPILIDEGKVHRAYKINSSPTYIVIGKDSKIRFIMGGYADDRPLKRAIEAALKE